MVMMLTAGLGVSEIMMGWDIITLEVGGVILLLLRNDAVDTPLHRFGKRDDVMDLTRRNKEEKLKAKHFLNPNLKTLHFSTNLFLFSPRLAFTFFFSCWALAWAVPLLTEFKKKKL